MKLDELRATLNEHINRQPRGFKAQLAHELDVTPTYINQVLSGRLPLQLDHLAMILERLELELVVAPKGTNERLRAVFSDPFVQPKVERNDT
ncbi:XRE family transcriptional regulator [Deinococcus yavapaiensis]|uniref:Helix-turn-helix protein n=1 Tax=Deinococcus yavapaiensis KR-236 TaxID=694435 RepID=A0A318SBG9_9DEIO|nr:XRE family transcriptional regulator [Deinococcus yavapaiensis]PYE55704.1 hypothetical protein DES52_10267 [Deinococcus yavapaiensis KR-236]